MTIEAYLAPQGLRGLPPVVDVCVVIPARGGSKGIPHKNLRPVGGDPLVSRAVRNALAADGVDAVVVSTDDPDIAAAARATGAAVVERPARIAGDTASSESAVLHALEVLAAEGHQPEVVVLIQATSPFIAPSDLGAAIAAVRENECDVAFSVTAAHDHLWRLGPTGPVGVNHDDSVRLRRQDREPEYRETGAFYVMRRSGFVGRRHRFFGRLQMIPVPPLDGFEIDTASDLVLAEALHAVRPGTVDLPIPARAVVTDFDGVHTDDRVRVDQHGVESVEVNRSDGMGVAMLRRAGVPMLVLSSETNPVVQARADKLGVPAVTGCSDKLTALRQWSASIGVDLVDIAFLGNDVNDVACLQSVGWPVVPADAHPAARAVARQVLRRPGGRGVVRELADRVLHAAQEGRDHG